VSKQTIGIVAKPKSERALELARQLIQWVEAKKIPYYLGEELVETLGSGAEVGVASRSEITSHCNPVVVLGGDGTFISVSRHPGKSPTTIIGVNVGTLGFLTEITADEMLKTVESVLSGEAEIEERNLLEVKLIRAGKTIAEYFALNDAVLTKEALARIFAVECNVDGQFATVVRGDGLVVSSRSGSTADSVAAGGSIVHPQVDALLITPISPFSLTTRPLVVPGKSRINLQLPESNGEGGQEVHLTVDGQTGSPLQGGDLIEVTTSKRSVRFAKSPSKNYFQILATKLKWALD